jgi:ferric-dicitrate binding protein FerR (iron transport regulator)
MCSQELIKKVDEGKAVVVTKTTIQWAVIVTVAIFILTNAVMFGMWKGGVDEKLDAHMQSNQERFIRLEEGGSKVALETQDKVDVVIHNLKRMMEKQGMKWEELK